MAPEEPTEPQSVTQDGGRRVRLHALQVVFAPTADEAASALVDAPVVIGREPGQGGLVLADPKASRRHARVERDPGGDGWQLVDEGSSNGTLVDGVRVGRTPVPLVDGSVIRIGHTILLHLDGEIDALMPNLPEMPDLLGQSAGVRRLRHEIALIAPRAVPVLILGESGVGKERVAAEIHAQSARGGAFVPVNCAAIAESVAESELFGHAAGAFTGAVGKADGLFVAADRGTLFLDELGELPASLQPKLLRALMGEIRPVGRAEVRKVDVRVVAATNRDMSTEVADERFRGDLWARLAAWTIDVPPLRARKDDLLRLFRAFVDREQEGLALSAGAAEALLLWGWPFNVRELMNVAVAAAIRASAEGTIRPSHLPAAVGGPIIAREEQRPAPTISPAELPAAGGDEPPSEEQLRRVIEHYRGNMARVSDFFRKDRQQIYRWARRFGIDVAEYRK